MNLQTPVAVPAVMSERRVSIIGASLVALGPMSMSLFTPAMPEMVHVFGTNEGAVKLTLSLYFAGFALAQLVCGPLSDGFGRRPVTFAFLGIYVASVIVAIFAPTIEVLIGARFMQGVGTAVGWSISRALVRDLFTHEQSARVMNLISLIMGLGPALAPTIGGLVFEAAGWQAIFVVMALFGLGVMLLVRFAMAETVVRDLSRFRPRALTRSYGTLLSHPGFVLSSLVMAGSVGALYTQATILPFILMDRVGLTPVQFGLGMLFQSLSFFFGSVCMRLLMKRASAYSLVPFGLAMMAIGSIAFVVGLRIWEPSFLGVMGPVAVYTFGIALVLPAMSTAALAPFPQIAGAAASMSGFFQMGGGLIGGGVAALIGEPVLAMATVIPCMGLIAIVSWVLWRLIPMGQQGPKVGV
jgi:DHA1 family bicyclomycin/chloramphenicol resistance-like MFS transporter